MSINLEEKKVEIWNSYMTFSQSNHQQTRLHLSLVGKRKQSNYCSSYNEVINFDDLLYQQEVAAVNEIARRVWRKSTKQKRT
jgi:hypothetical protein